MPYDRATAGPRRTPSAVRGTTSDRLPSEGKPDPRELAEWTAKNKAARLAYFKEAR